MPNNQIVNTILLYGDEFQIGYILHKLHPSLKVNRQQGPDFNLGDFGIKVRRPKSKLNRRYLGYISNPTTSLDKITCLKPSSKDVFESGRLEEAFDYQQTDIAIMNLSHSQLGICSYAFGLNNSNLKLSEAFEEAIKMARAKEKAMILYSEQVSIEQPYSICAIVSDKYKIDDYGSRLDKIEKDLKIDTKTTDGYYRLIDETRKLP